MDWKTKLFQILDCFAVQEGCWFENKWKEFGVTDEETARINDEFNKYEKHRHSKRQSYVAGFYFSNSPAAHGRTVALVLKNKPEWQKGKLNAIGGKVEEGETHAQAMRREFYEETGVDIESWDHVVILRGEDWDVHFFRAFGNPHDCQTVEAEQIGVYDYVSLPTNVIPNLRWLVPLCLDVNLNGPIVVEEH